MDVESLIEESPGSNAWRRPYKLRWREALILASCVPSHQVSPWLQCHEHQALAKALPPTGCMICKILLSVSDLNLVHNRWYIHTSQSHRRSFGLAWWRGWGHRRYRGTIVTSDTRKFETCLFSWSISSAAQTAPICRFLSGLKVGRTSWAPKLRCRNFTTETNQAPKIIKKHFKKWNTPTSSKWTSIFSAFPCPKLKLFRLSRMFRPA